MLPPTPQAAEAERLISCQVFITDISMASLQRCAALGNGRVTRWPIGKAKEKRESRSISGGFLFSLFLNWIRCKPVGAARERGAALGVGLPSIGTQISELGPEFPFRIDV